MVVFAVELGDFADRSGALRSREVRSEVWGASVGQIRRYREGTGEYRERERTGAGASSRASAVTGAIWGVAGVRSERSREWIEESREREKGWIESALVARGGWCGSDSDLGTGSSDLDVGVWRGSDPGDPGSGLGSPGRGRQDGFGESSGASCCLGSDWVGALGCDWKVALNAGFMWNTCGICLGRDGGCLGSDWGFGEDAGTRAVRERFSQSAAAIDDERSGCLLESSRTFPGFHGYLLRLPGFPQKSPGES